MNTIRPVLDAMFTELGQSQLTHKLLVTPMAEVVAIVNARPIAALPSDVDDPHCDVTHYEDTPSRTPSRPVHAHRYLRSLSMEASPVPCGTILD